VGLTIWRVVLWRRRRLKAAPAAAAEEDLFDDYDWDDQAEWLESPPGEEDEYESGDDEAEKREASPPDG